MNTVVYRIGEFIQDQRIANQWEYSTVKMMQTFQHHVAVFGQAKDLSFFDAAGIDRFVAYLRQEAELQDRYQD